MPEEVLAIEDRLAHVCLVEAEVICSDVRERQEQAFHGRGTLAFGGSHLGQVDVEEADRIGVELFPAWPVSLYSWQAADAMALQTPMKEERVS